MVELDEYLPNIEEAQFTVPSTEQFRIGVSTHPVRILLLYGSLRERSYSRLVIEECARLLERYGAQVRIFNPTGLPQPDGDDGSHPKVQELRELMMWSEG